MTLPNKGMVGYYRTLQNIPGIGEQKLFAIVRYSDNMYQLVVQGQGEKNIDSRKAIDLVSMSKLIKQESDIMEGKKRMKGVLESLLFEADSAIAAAETDPVEVPDVSLDRKVDRYLVSYEKEAIPTSTDYSINNAIQSRVNASENPIGSNATPTTTTLSRESKNPTKGLLESLLFEAPGDPGEEQAPPADDMEGGMGLGDDMGMDTGEAPEGNAPLSPPVIDTPKMNMDVYARSVARLISNYESLLDPKVTILNRAKEYIKVNYDEATATMFEEVMKNHYNISVETERRDQRDAPPAVGAIWTA